MRALVFTYGLLMLALTGLTILALLASVVPEVLARRRRRAETRATDRTFAELIADLDLAEPEDLDTAPHREGGEADS